MLDYVMRQQEVPARYMLEFDDASATLTLYIHPGVLEHIGNILHAFDARLLTGINKHCETLETLPLVWDPVGDMGCGKIMLYQGEQYGWRVWRIPLPTIFEQGKSPHDWSPGFAVSISLQTIFQWSLDQNLPGSTCNNQMICYKLAVDKRIYGGAIGARLSIQANNLIKTLNKDSKERILDEIFDSLQQAWEAMEPNPYWKRLETAREINFALNSAFNLHYPEHGGIIINVPGNATGIGPVPMNMDPDDLGIELEPHNTDTPMQQLTLLAGLAKLEMLLREKLTTP